MGQRTSPAKRIPGSPLAGMLRHHAQQLRRPSRRTATAVAASDLHVAPAATAVAAPVLQCATAVAVSGPDGAAVWKLPFPFTAPPVVTAVAEATGPVFCTVLLLSCEEVQVAVWSLDAVLSQLEPAQGVRVHLTVRG